MENDLKLICEAIPSSYDADISTQAHNILKALTGEEVEFSISSGDQPKMVNPSISIPYGSSINNLYSWVNVGGFSSLSNLVVKDKTTGEVLGQGSTSVSISSLPQSRDGHVIEAYCEGTNFITSDHIEKVFHYVDPTTPTPNKLRFNFSNVSTPSNFTVAGLRISKYGSNVTYFVGNQQVTQPDDPEGKFYFIPVAYYIPNDGWHYIINEIEIYCRTINAEAYSSLLSSNNVFFLGMAYYDGLTSAEISEIEALSQNEVLVKSPNSWNKVGNRPSQDSSLDEFYIYKYNNSNWNVIISSSIQWGTHIDTYNCWWPVYSGGTTCYGVAYTGKLSFKL